MKGGSVTSGRLRIRSDRTLRLGSSRAHLTLHPFPLGPNQVEVQERVGLPRVPNLPKSQGGSELDARDPGGIQS